MNNAEWMIKNDMRFSRLTWAHINGRNIVYYRKNKSVAIEIYSEKSVNPENLITKWLDMEHVEPVLDDTEKMYLKGVIRPFSDKVLYIAKRSIMDRRKEHIYIDLTYDVITLPCFMKGTMYKGMELDHWYTLKELGL